MMEFSTTSHIIVQGSCGVPFTANQGSYFEFDPNGGGGTIDCGTGISDTTFWQITDNSVVQLGTGWTFANCAGANGGTDLALLRGNSTFANFSGNQLPGTGELKVLDNSVYYPAYVPTLGTCANAHMQGNDTNYSMRVMFSGANSSCALNFGAPAAPATAYFGTTPNCIPSVSTSTPGKTATLQSLSPFGFTIVPSAPFVSGESAIIACHATSAG
jgi:hypothetical protein